MLVPLLDALTVSASPTITEYTGVPAYGGPSSIVADPDGFMYFTEGPAPTGSLGYVSVNGNVASQYFATSAAVQSLTVGPDGNLWFVEQAAGRIGKTGAGYTGNPTEYSLPAHTYPVNITSGPDGNMWFTYYVYAPGTGLTWGIGQITTSGAITEYPDSIPGTYLTGGITAGPDGALWFSDQGTNSVGQITTSGAITEYPLPANGYPATSPNAITAGSDGALWVTDTNSVIRITTNGSITSYPLPAAEAADASVETIASDPGGSLWFTDEGNNAVGQITTSGTISEYQIPTPSSAPNSITAGPDGNMWFTESNGDKIGRITVPPAVPTPIIATNAGGSAVDNFAADTGFSGGATYSSTESVDTSEVTNPAPQSVYQSARYGNNFSYNYSGLTPNTSYTLQLDFNELYWGTDLSGSGGVGSRVFNVAVNGQTALTNFDIYAAAGGSNKAIAEQIPTTADANGNITVTFTAVTDNAMVNGLELYDGTIAPPPPQSPATTAAYINSGGSTSGSFSADEDYSGGTPYSSTAGVDTTGVANPAPESVYQSARYGNNFAYTIPNLKPNTSFNIRLDFNELYWGTALANNSGGIGSRVFNVAINGNQVLSNFDIYQIAGGANKAIAENFTATSDADGRIVIQFTSVTDNAMVNGIEVTQQ